MSINKYLNLITSEHRQQPNFIAWLSAALQKVDDGMTMTNGIPSDFSIDNAVGNQLDVVGQVVGANRNVGVPLSSGSSILDDDHYRTYIRAKIARNQWDGTIGQIYTLWNSLFPNSQLQIIDNQNMSMQAIVTGLSDTVSLDLITAGLIIPKPAGVSLTVIGSTTVSTATYSGGIVNERAATSLTVDAPIKQYAFVGPGQVAVVYLA